MAFAYREVTISGATAGVEGTAKFMQEIKDVLVNQMGWTLTDDQSARASTSHQITFESRGELGNVPTYYLVLTSGTGNSGAAAQSLFSMHAATAWSTSTHRVPSSGIASPTSSGSVRITTSTNTNFTGWISGDKDGVAIVSKVAGSYDAGYIGRVTGQFTNVSQDAFPVYVLGNSSTSVDAATDGGNCFSFLDSTTILGAGETSVESMYVVPLDQGLAPNTGIYGFTEAYVATPLVASVTLTNPSRRSTRGFVPNLWTTIGRSAPNSTITQEDELITADGKVYKMFFNNNSSSVTTVIRKS